MRGLATALRKDATAWARRRNARIKSGEAVVDALEALVRGQNEMVSCCTLAGRRRYAFLTWNQIRMLGVVERCIGTPADQQTPRAARGRARELYPASAGKARWVRTPSAASEEVEVPAVAPRRRPAVRHPTTAAPPRESPPSPSERRRRRRSPPPAARTPSPRRHHPSWELPRRPRRSRSPAAPRRRPAEEERRGVRRSPRRLSDDELSFY